MEKNKGDIIESENLQAQYDDRAAQYDVRDNALNAALHSMSETRFETICKGREERNRKVDQRPCCPREGRSKAPGEKEARGL